MAGVLLAAFGNVNAQIETLTASQHWNEINSLKLVQERKSYIRKLTAKQKAELVIEHTNRKLNSMSLTDEQRQAVIDARDSITAEFFTESLKAGEDKSKNPTVVKIMKAYDRAAEVLTSKQTYEIFCLIGDRETLDDPNPGGC
jgi:hypothetical protein